MRIRFRIGSHLQLLIRQTFDHTALLEFDAFEFNGAPLNLLSEHVEGTHLPINVFDLRIELDEPSVETAKIIESLLHGSQSQKLLVVCEEHTSQGHLRFEKSIVNRGLVMLELSKQSEDCVQIHVRLQTF
jgi:RNA binding exosome subunit